MIDAHHYQVYTFRHWAEEPDGWSKHLAEVCRYSQDISGSPLDVIIGEFSLAITDCRGEESGERLASDLTCQ